MKKLVLLLVSALILTGCAGGSQVASKSFVSGNGTVTFIEAKDRKEGPIFSGLTLEGENFELPHGGIVVINVWASWCAPCRAEAPTLVELAKKYKGVVFLGILTRDSVVAARAFQERFQLPYPTLVDDSVLLKFAGTLSANAIPSTILIDSDGRVAARISGEATYSTLRDLIEKLHKE